MRLNIISNTLTRCPLHKLSFFQRTYTTKAKLLSFDYPKNPLPPSALFSLANPQDMIGEQQKIKKQLSQQGIAVLQFAHKVWPLRDLEPIIKHIGGDLSIEKYGMSPNGIVEITSTPQANNAGFALHTDGSNANTIESGQLLTRAPSLVVLAHETPAKQGGDCFVADGKAILTQLIERKPELLSWLLSPLPEKMKKYQEVFSCFPIISRYKTRWLISLIHNPSKLDISEEEPHKKNFLSLFDIINENLIHVGSQSNRVIIIDNHRMLHGRTPILEGHRIIYGAWFSISDFLTGIELSLAHESQLLNMLNGNDGKIRHYCAS